MEIFIIWLLRIVIGGGILLFCWNLYKKAENNIHKLLYVTAFVSWIILVIIYELDRNNIPTKWGWTENINTQNWLMFLGTYLPSIISAMVGAIFMIAVTITQIEHNRKDSEKRDMENLRIQNMPILEYNIDSLPKTKDVDAVIMTKCEEGNSYRMNLTISNIGSNIIRSLKVDLKSDIINGVDRVLGKGTIIPMSKENEMSLNKILLLTQCNKPYKFEFTVYYQDILTNWYKQEIIVYYETANRGRIDFIVNKEELLKDKDYISSLEL